MSSSSGAGGSGPSGAGGSGPDSIVRSGVGGGSVGSPRLCAASSAMAADRDATRTAHERIRSADIADFLTVWTVQIGREWPMTAIGGRILLADGSVSIGSSHATNVPPACEPEFTQFGHYGGA